MALTSQWICPAWAATCKTIWISAPSRAPLGRSRTITSTNRQLPCVISCIATGPSNAAEAGGFVRSRFAQDDRCDIQFHFIPAQLDDHGNRELPGRGYTLHACYLHPRSRGRIRLASADPARAASIDANYLGDPEGHDLKLMIEVAKLSRAILNQPAFASHRGETRYPEHALQNDADIEEFIRRRAETIYHPVGTCRMGNDHEAVVDSELRVRGVENLRVVDASVMPTLISGNTNAPTIMIAERAASLMLA